MTLICYCIKCTDKFSWEKPFASFANNPFSLARTADIYLTTTEFYSVSVERALKYLLSVGDNTMSAILVIDDERRIADLILEALGMFGHEVEIATNGREGIQKFDNNDFDLVITDIRMPVADGNSVVHHIRNSEKKYTPIIGMSGTPWLLENDEFDLVISKPFPLQILIESVENLPDIAAWDNLRRVSYR